MLVILLSVGKGIEGIYESVKFLATNLYKKSINSASI